MAPYHLDCFNWKYNPDLPQDANYADLAMALTRNSHCDGGHMGCCVVQDGCVCMDGPLGWGRAWRGGLGG